MKNIIITGGAGFIGSHVVRLFDQDIPLKFRVEFSGISDYANKFALVKIPMMSRGAMSLSDKKPVIIRNIEWEK